jgi:hypothetical protein
MCSEAVFLFKNNYILDNNKGGVKIAIATLFLPKNITLTYNTINTKIPCSNASNKLFVRDILEKY